MSRSFMGRRAAITGEEADAFGRGRRLYCYLARPGVANAIKRTARRRERHQAAALIREDLP